MNKTNIELANLFFENLDRLEFDQLGDYITNILQQHGFYETACVSVSDGGVPAGNICRTGFYSSDLQAAAVVELSQDWDDYCNDESDSIEWRDYYYIRVYLYSVDKPFDNDDLYFLGDYEESMIFYYSRSNYNDLYVE